MHFTRHSTYDTHRCRRSCAATASTSGTPTATSTSTGWPACSSYRRDTVAPSSPRPPRSRPPSWRSSRSGPTPTPARSTWPSASPGYAPGDLNRVFFTTGGGEAVETAWKLAKHYFKLTGKPTKHKVISRAIAYHGTPQGALSITGLPGMKAPFEPLVPSTFRVPNTNFYRRSQTRHQMQYAVPGHAEARTTCTPSASGPPTGSPRRSSSRAPTPSPRSSSSRCRTPAAASRRPPATSSGCARSATSTTCCWSPTRSSAPSAGSATCSPPSATATSPTSSPAPRA